MDHCERFVLSVKKCLHAPTQFQFQKTMMDLVVAEWNNIDMKLLLNQSARKERTMACTKSYKGQLRD